VITRTHNKLFTVVQVWKITPKDRLNGRKEVLPRLFGRRDLRSEIKYFTNRPNKRKDSMYYQVISQCVHMLKDGKRSVRSACR
jgi:hypothetical protein